MAGAKKVGPTAPITIRVFDGTRDVMKEGVRILLRLIDGNQKERLSKFVKKPVVRADVPFANSLADRYTIVVSANKYLQSGFAPVRVKPGVLSIVDLMLLPKENAFNFGEAAWEKLQQNHPKLFGILAHGAGEVEARGRYTELIEMPHKQPNLAALLNITTAMETIFLPSGKPLDYIKELIWNDPGAPLRPDRFFAFADAALVGQIELAEQQGAFRQEPLPGLFHPGATRSYKQVQFGEANVQLTFHEGDKRKIDGVNCLKVEADMDYFKDPLAHALIEVLPNSFGGMTDPRQIYVLRWIAGRRSGVPEFNPPYMIVES